MFGARKLWKEDIDKHTESNGCLPKSGKKHLNNNGVVDVGQWAQENPESFWELAAGGNECSDNFYNDGEKTGCCFTSSMDNKCLSDKHSTGMVYHVTGDNGGGGHLCHKEEIQGIYNTLFDDNDKMVKFFKLVLFSIISLLVTALIGTCYEFWLRYGSSVDCIYYKSKCVNIGKNNKISLIDYMFPNNLCYYPYQSCAANKLNQSGGNKQVGGVKTAVTGIISTFAEYEGSGAKCITLDHDNSVVFGGKPIPYNVADYAINNLKSEYMTVLAKTISFYFLFPVLCARKVLNWIMTNLSSKFQKYIKFNPVLSNLSFLALTGLLFPIIGYMLEIPGLYFGPMLLFTGLLILTNILTSVGFFVALISTIIPNRIYGTMLSECNLSADYYRIFSSELFYPLKEGKMSTKVLNIVKNLLIFFPLIFLTILSIVLAAIMCVISSFYMSFSLLINMIVIPLSNPLECFSILKSHADMLTILFILGVIVASANSLDSVTTGTMSMLLALIIAYKAFMGTMSSL
jgi:hypothetical protein